MKRSRFRLTLETDEHGNYLEPSPYQGGRCVWPDCRYPRDTERVDEHLGRTAGLPLCTIHAMEVHRIVSMSFATRRNPNIIDRHGRTRINAEPREGWIYYIRSGDKIKIGHSIRPKQRIRAYPPDTLVLAIHRGSKEDEKELHSRFQTYLVAGREWYEPGAALMEHIRSMVHLYGPTPDDVHPHRMKTGRATVRLRARSRW